MSMAERWKRAKEMAARAYEVGFDGYDAACRDLFDALTSAQIEQLQQLVRRGPLWDGDVISKAARDDLLTLRLASRALVKGREGYTVANYVGANVLRTSGVWLHPFKRGGGCGAGECRCEALTEENARLRDEVKRHPDELADAHATGYMDEGRNWSQAFNKQRERAEKAEAEVERLRSMYPWLDEPDEPDEPDKEPAR